MEAGYDIRKVQELLDHSEESTIMISTDVRNRGLSWKPIRLSVSFFEIGTHGDTQAHMPALDTERQKEEILGSVRLLKTHYDRGARLFRPPYGEFNDQTVEVARSLGLQFVLWSIITFHANGRAD